MAPSLSRSLGGGGGKKIFFKGERDINRFGISLPAFHWTRAYRWVEQKALHRADGDHVSTCREIIHIACNT